MHPNFFVRPTKTIRWLLFFDYTFIYNNTDSINVKLGSQSHAAAAAAAAAAAIHIV